MKILATTQSGITLAGPTYSAITISIPTQTQRVSFSGSSHISHLRRTPAAAPKRMVPWRPRPSTVPSRVHEHFALLPMLEELLQRFLGFRIDLHAAAVALLIHVPSETGCKTLHTSATGCESNTCYSIYGIRVRSVCPRCTYKHAHHVHAYTCI